MRLSDLPEAAESIDIAAPIERIWPLISDITFAVGRSPELQAVNWTEPGDPVPCVGRTFVGTNSNAHFGTWDTTATVVECDQPTVFGWKVGDIDQPNTTWRFTTEPVDAGVTVTQWVRIGPGPSGLAVAVERMPDKEERIVARRLEEFRAAMRANLEAIKQAAESA